MKPRVRILLVEDETLLRAQLTDALEAARYDVIPADSADQALFFACSSRAGLHPQLLIVDQAMRGRSGADLVRALRARETLRWRPILGISALAASRETLLAAGACDFLLTPVEPDALLAAVRGLLARCRLDGACPCPLPIRTRR